jgi:hypothetical protein
MGQFLIPALAVALLVAALQTRRSLRRGIVVAAAGLGAAALVLAPVIARNVATFDAWRLTSQGGGHALHWVMPAALAFANGSPFEETQARMQARLIAAGPRAPNPFEDSDRAMALAREAAHELGPAGLAKAWIAGTLVNLAAPAAFAVPPIQALERPSFYSTPGNGLIAKLATYVRATESRPVLTILAVSVTLLLAVRAVQVVGLLARWRDMGRWPWLVLLAVTVVAILVTGPVTGVKYRLPLEPLLSILAAAGLVRLGPSRRRGGSGRRLATMPPRPRS